jgi:hypothetical protein
VSLWLKYRYQKIMVAPKVLTKSQKTLFAGLGAILILAAIKLGLHLIFNRGYGYFRDELYYIICGRNLAIGYVDQPPLVAFIAAIEEKITGTSLSSFRFLPALAGAIKVLLAGLIAREMGGRRYAQLLAGAAVLFAPIFLGIDNFLSMNAFEPVFWGGCLYVTIRLINGANPKLWLIFGLLAGLGFENKHSMVFFGAGLFIGLLLTDARRLLASPWCWIGLSIGALVALPNIIWQFQNNFATFELLKNVKNSNKNIVLGPVPFFLEQIKVLNPLSGPLWIGGLLWLLVSKSARRYRYLGICYLATFAIIVALKGKNYYLVPIYPMLFAAGGAGLELWVTNRKEDRFHLAWLPVAYLLLLIITGSLLMPLALPILKPEQYVGYAKAVHLEPPRSERSHTAALPQIFADQFGWPEMTRQVADAFNTLSAEEQREAVIFTSNYGEASAINFFGTAYNLPPAISGHQNYFLWGTRGASGNVMIVIDDDDESLRKIYDEVLLYGRCQHPWAETYENSVNVYICRGIKQPLNELWPRAKKWL